MSKVSAKTLLNVAEEVSGWGAGNEAGIIRMAADEITRLRAERDEAAKALEPFAAEAPVWDGYDDAECLVEDFPGLSLPSTINVGHLRTAAAIVKRGEERT